MIGLARSTVSPSSSIMIRSTPWVDGCWGPMLMIIVSSSPTSMSMSPASRAVAPSAARTMPPSSMRRSAAVVPSRESISWVPSEVSATRRLSSSVWLIVASTGSGGFLELHRHPPDGVVLAQRMALPVLRHQDPGQVGMAGEADPEHVEGLALGGLDAGIEIEQGRDRRIGLGHLHPDADAPALLHRDEVHHDLEALGMDLGRKRAPAMAEVVDSAHVDAHLETLVLEPGNDLQIVVTRRVDDLAGGRRHQRGVPTCTGTGCSTCSSAPAPEARRRRVISPVRIFSCRVRIECSNVSGVGGHPGV